MLDDFEKQAINEFIEMNWALFCQFCFDMYGLDQAEAEDILDILR